MTELLSKFPASVITEQHIYVWADSDSFSDGITILLGVTGRGHIYIYLPIYTS